MIQVLANRIGEIRQIRVKNKLQGQLKNAEKVTRESLEWPSWKTQMSGANSVLPKIKMMFKGAKKS